MVMNRAGITALKPELPLSAAAFGFRLTYAITPPNRTTSRERRRAIAAAYSARIAQLPIDALLVYDVQDEAVRNAVPRPFPFAPKVDPLTYAFEELALAELPRVVYRAVTGENAVSLCVWLDALQARGGSAILVGTPSRHSAPSLTLSEALSLCRRHAPRVAFGGVVIPERHQARSDEDARVWRKMESGCRFFVSQTVWSAATAERLLDDLCRRAEREGRTMPPVVLSLSPCGSRQTLEFLEWLGVEVPEPVKRELKSARDMLARSIDLGVDTFERLHAFATHKGFTVGCNVESVSSRAVEVEASIELVYRIDQLLARHQRSSALAHATLRMPRANDEA